MKAVFFGTPDFAAGILKKLIFGHTVTLVVTRSDKAAGRKKVITKPPVKTLALNHGIEVIQPENLRNAEFIEQFKHKTQDADIFVVAAYGKILPKAILDIPRLFCVNVHASLLPLYRGAAPIQRAIIDGRQKTGITIMRMDEGVDTGDIILQSEVTITDTDTGGSLTEKLSAQGAVSLMEALDLTEQGRVTFTKQDNNLATYAPVITKADCIINFDNSAEGVYNQIRALLPDNTAYMTYNGINIKVPSASITDTKKTPAANGEVISVTKDGITVACAGGSILIKEVIPQGGKRMDAVSFTRGRHIKPGDVFT